MLPDDVVKTIRSQASHALHTRIASRIIVEDFFPLIIPKYADPRSLIFPSCHIFSQSTEDAVLTEIFSRIGHGRKRFLEIGASDGRQNATRFLLEFLGWGGVWIEGSAESCALASKKFAGHVETGRLRIQSALVTKDNINEIIADDGPFDLIVIDIDQNTTHLWRAISASSRVACIEYNSHIPRSVDWEVDYDEKGVWNGTNLFGGSLKAIENIGHSKNMALVGCDLAGVNSYLVAKTEDLSKFQEPFTAEHHYEPPRFGLIDHRGYRRKD